MILVALLVGHSANRIIHETSKAAGYPTYYSPEFPPSWIGVDTPRPWRTADDEFQREEEAEGEQGRKIGCELPAVEKELVFKEEHERIRDEKMEEVVKRFG